MCIFLLGQLTGVWLGEEGEVCEGKDGEGVRKRRSCGIWRRMHKLSRLEVLVGAETCMKDCLVT